MMTTEEREHQMIINKNRFDEKHISGNSSMGETQTNFENKVVNYEIGIDKYKIDQ
jgi:hypothetical protein